MAWGGLDSSFYYMARTLFSIVGVAKLSVNGIIIAPNPALQNNFLRYNWPAPPLKIDHVSYVYVSGDEHWQVAAC